MNWDGWRHLDWLWASSIAAIVAAVVAFVLGLEAAEASSRGPTEVGASAEEILKHREARGEASNEEYEPKQEDLCK